LAAWAVHTYNNNNNNNNNNNVLMFVPARFRASAAIQRRAATRFLCV